MTIEIHQPELEALIQERMSSGEYQSVEDVLLTALQSLQSTEEEEAPVWPSLSGERLIAAMQASPAKDLSLEPERMVVPIRDVRL